MTMKHSEHCLNMQAVRKQERDAYEIQWPHHCVICEGRGGTSYEYDPSPPGVGLSPGTMTDFNPCPYCQETMGQCPRCAAAWTPDIWEDEKPCPVCGWDWCKVLGSKDAKPEEWECGCLEVWQAGEPYAYP